MRPTTPAAVPPRDALWDAACDYAVRGWPVLLLAADGKRPLWLRDLQQNAWRSGTTDVIELDRRFREAGVRVGGIGIVTGKVPDEPGTGPAVVDLDGRCAVAWANRRFAQELAAGALVAAKTSKGRHLYFESAEGGRAVKAQVEGFACTCGGGCGVDILCGSGYVAAPPSVGKTWLVSPGKAALTPLPDDLREMAQAERRYAPRAGGIEHTGEVGAGVKRVLAALEKRGIAARPRTPAGPWEFCCPAHDDRTPSAAVGQGRDHKAYVKCLAGCHLEDILTPLGLDIKDLYDHPRRPDGPGGGGKWRTPPRPVVSREAHLDALVEAAVALPTPPAPAIERAEAELAEALGSEAALKVIQAVTGLGKTRQTAELQAASGRWATVVTQTHDLGKEWERRWRAAGVPNNEIAHHIGRRTPTQEEAELFAEAIANRSADKVVTPPGVCLKPELVAEIALGNHLVAASACTTCPHGLAAQLVKASRKKDPQRKFELEDRLRERGLDPATVIPCGAIPQFAKENATPLVLLAGTAVAPSQVNASGGKTRELVVDEVPTLAKELQVRASDVAKWEDRVTNRLAWLRARLDEAEKRGNTEAAQAWQDAIDLHETMIDELLDHTQALRVLLSGRHGAPKVEDVADEAKAIRGVAERWLTKESETAEWERVEIEWKRLAIEHLEVPLKAAIELGGAAVRGTLYLEGREHNQAKEYVARAFGPNALGQTVLLRASTGDPTTILDATPSAGVRAAIEHLGGEVRTAIERQPVRVLDDPSHLMGRGRLDQQVGRTEEAVGIIREMRTKLAEQLGCAPADIPTLTHKPWAEACASSGMAGEFGWWGRDERGHNRWENAPGLLIVGPPLVPPSALRDAYRADRAFALAAGCSPDDWPEWDDDDPMPIRQIVRVGGTDVAWAGRLPADDHLRAWVLDYYGRSIAQAVGRLRGIRRDDAPVVVMLGPTPDLSAYGIHVEVFDGEGSLALAPTAADRGEARRVEAEVRVLKAVTALQDDGQRATYPAIQEWLREKTGKTVSRRVIARVKGELKGGATPEDLLERRIARLAGALTAGVVRTLRDDLPAGVKAEVLALAVSTSRVVMLPRARRREVTKAQGELRGAVSARAP